MMRTRVRRGQTLVELLAGLFATAIVFTALAALYKTTNLFQAKVLREQPLQRSSSSIIARLSQDIAAATCARASAGGRVLLLHLGRDCSGAAVDPAADRFALYCVAPVGAGAGPGKVLFTSGPWGELSAAVRACDPAYGGWKSLTLPTVQATGGFSLPSDRDFAQPKSWVLTSLTLALDPAFDREGEARPVAMEWLGSMSGASL